MEAININTATVEELCDIPKIKDKRTAAIIKRREELGNLNLEQLKSITEIPSTIWDPLVKAGLVIFGDEKDTDKNSGDGEITERQAEVHTLRGLLQALEDGKRDMERRIEEDFAKFRKEMRGHSARDVDRFSRRKEELTAKIQKQDEMLARQERDLKYSLKPSVVDNHSSVSQERKRGGPSPPKMSTFDGRNDWKPYFVQFSYIAGRYQWSAQESLDKLIEGLRDKALKYFCSRSKTIQQDYTQLCKTMEERFGRREMPHIIRRQLHSLKQNVDEPLEEYAERAQELATEGYPNTSDEVIQMAAVDAFLKGCSEKRAALTAMDKYPDTLDEAIQFVRSAVTNQKIILGSGTRTEFKRVAFYGDLSPLAVRVLTNAADHLYISGSGNPVISMDYVGWLTTL